MDKYIAREFVCMVAKKLDLPSFIYEEMENKLTTSQIRLFFKEHYGIELN